MPKEEAATKGLSIVANRLLHPRIFKAVMKEKWMDMGYKLRNDPYTAIMTHRSEYSKLTFYLEQKRYITGADL